MENSLQVYLPYPKKLISQKYGVNANVSYARDGLLGHTAYDWDAAFGSPVPNCVKNAYCYSILNENNSDPSKYRAVYTIVETETGVYEVSYGHFNEIYAEVGDTYQPGDILGTVGNTGTVFSGNHEVTKQERLNGSKAGAHLHGPQVRLVKKVTKKATKKKYLTTANGTFKDKNGFYYEVIDYDNGFNGCIHPYQPFSTESLAIDYRRDQIVKETLPQIAEAVAALPSLPVSEQKPRISFIQKLIQMLAELF